MLTKPFLFIAFVCMALAFQSCNDYKETDSGLQYKLIVDSAGENARHGDMVLAHIKYQNEKDTFDSYKRGYPIPFSIDTTQKDAIFEEALINVSKGDSISFKLLNDSLYLGVFGQDSLPEGIKAGGYTTLGFKIVDVISKSKLEADRKKQLKERTMQQMSMFEEYKKGMLDTSAAQLKKDDAIIQKHLKQNKITDAKRTENGVYVVVKEEGNGPAITPGDSVSVHYTGKLLNGEEFDKSMPDRPFEFQIGLGRAIPGFDEALMQLKKGSKATIYIPSSLAYAGYGVMKSPTEYAIKPNTVLVFDLEVVNVTKME